jgi:hypothetical protein
MWRVINLLTVRRLVTVSGAPGVGKSALLAGSCQYLAARDVFKGGILFVRLGHRAVAQARFLELLEDALLQQADAVDAANRREGSSPSPLPPLPSPRVPRAADLLALQHDSALPGGVHGQGLLGDLARRAAREAWVIGALRERSALLVVDHADALLHQSGDLGQGRGRGSGAGRRDGKPLSLRLSHDAGGAAGGAGDQGSSDEDEAGDGLDEEGGGVRGFLGRLFHGARHMKVLLATNAAAADAHAPSSAGGGGSSGGLPTGRGDHLVSAVVPLGPLTLHDAVRLFCRLSPRLRTAKERKQCLEFLAPPKDARPAAQAGAAHAREAALLAEMGNGFPGHIVQLALAEASLDRLVSVAKAHPLIASPAAAPPAPPESPVPVPTPALRLQPLSDAPVHLPGSAQLDHAPLLELFATAAAPSEAPTVAGLELRPLEGQPLVRVQSQHAAGAEVGDVPH